MSKIQGYIKPIFSTTLRIWRKERDQIELAWDGQDILLYRNGKYLRKITDTPTIQIEVWDEEEAYLAGDNFVSYKSPDYEFLPDDSPYSEEYIYRCVENTSRGESPETHPDKWSRQGKVGTTGENTVFISDVSGLEDRLDEYIKYTDLSTDFKVDSSSNEVSLDIHYFTVSNYSPAEDIQPESDEVRIGDTIWKTSNESWDDGGEGIYYPDDDANNVGQYGLLYTWDATQRLLDANPGYRLPYELEVSDLDRSILDIPYSGISVINSFGDRIYGDFNTKWMIYRDPGFSYDSDTGRYTWYAFIWKESFSENADMRTRHSNTYDDGYAMSIRLVKDI